MSPERRTHARRVLYSPEYLDMGADNGGVVVNLSEAGLAFQAVGPVMPEVEIPLSFSLGPGYRIDVSARVVWVNTEGKLGGAVFGKLSKDSRSLIREWLAKPDVEHETESGFVAPVQETDAGAGPVQGVRPADPLTSAATVQEGESPAGPAPTAGTALPAHDLNPAAQPSEPTPFVQPPMPSAPMPANEAIALEPLTTPPPNRMPAAPVAAKQQDVPVTRAVEKQAATLPPRSPQRERSSAASYSVAPSISSWSKNDSSVTTNATPGSGGPLFPPRGGENIFARSSNIEPERRGRGAGLLLVFAIVIAAGAVVAFYARTHRQQIGNEITHIGNTIAGTPAAASTTVPPQASAPTANQAASPANGNASTSPAKPALTLPPVASQTPAGSPTLQQSPQPGATSLPGAPKSAATHNIQPSQPRDQNASSGATKAPVPTKGQPVANPSKGTAANSSAASPYSGQAEYQRAENYLNGKGVPQDSAQAAEWFWRSLEAGNTSAAVPLADLYLAGNGVSRSCTQARILLDAAAQKNNAIAIKKLSELPESCR